MLKRSKRNEKLPGRVYDFNWDREICVKIHLEYSFEKTKNNRRQMTPRPGGFRSMWAILDQVILFQLYYSGSVIIHTAMRPEPAIT